jgi:hypothetical protein
MRNVNVNEPQNQQSCQNAVISRFYIFLVKYVLLKPLVQINYVVNGKMMGEIKWYQRSFTTPIRSRFLNTISYNLSKYVMFY